MPTYSNGRIPLDLLVVFARGWNKTDGNWYHALSPTTYAKHLALVQRAKQRTGRRLVITSGWSAYRPYEAQVQARKIHGKWAAVPGTSSHGGFWEGRQTLAMDYGNWKWVYGNGDGKDTPDKRAAFFDDCRAVGLTPDLISPRRGYPDEPWHVVDLDPWGPIPASNGAIPFPIPLPEPEEEDMTHNAGFKYTRRSDGKEIILLSNTQSKWWMEYVNIPSVVPAGNTPIAKMLGIEDAFVEVSEDWATAHKVSLGR